MTAFCTTLNAIRACNPCDSSWRTLLKGLGKTEADDEPLPFERILDICGFDDALWAARAAPQYDHEWRLLAVAFARRVKHLMTDPRSVAALDVAERFAAGTATKDELAAARAAAWAAAWAGAWDAAGDAARAAAGAAAYAAYAAAAAAAYDAAYDAAARAAERAAQREMFLHTVRGES